MAPSNSASGTGPVADRPNRLTVDLNRGVGLVEIAVGEKSQPPSIEISAEGASASLFVAEQFPFRLVVGDAEELVLAAGDLAVQVAFSVRRARGVAKATLIELPSRRSTSIAKQNLAAARIARRRARNLRELGAVLLRRRSIAEMLPQLKSRYAVTAAGSHLKLLLYRRISNLQREREQTTKQVRQLQFRIVTGSRALADVNARLESLRKISETQATIDLLLTTRRGE